LFSGSLFFADNLRWADLHPVFGRIMMMHKTYFRTPQE
jgi:hypothetical protein